MPTHHYCQQRLIIIIASRLINSTQPRTRTCVHVKCPIWLCLLGGLCHTIIAQFVQVLSLHTTYTTIPFLCSCLCMYIVYTVHLHTCTSYTHTHTHVTVHTWNNYREEVKVQFGNRKHCQCDRVMMRGSVRVCVCVRERERERERERLKKKEGGSKRHTSAYVWVSKSTPNC